jgi:CheY-like chemotaxis protein
MKIEIAEGIDSMLIVEDEALVAMLMETLAIEMGVADIVCCSTIEAAVAAANAGKIDLAVLDLRLGEDNTNVVADALAERGIPFVFSSGSDLAMMAERHQSRPLLAKPFSDDQFKLAIADAHHAARRERAAAE